VESTMTKNTGASYEVLVQGFLEQILNQNYVHTIKVERDVVLSGNATTHQIDLCWQFEIGGIDYTTIVQAKDWQTPVKKGQLAEFKYILDDLPNQPRGIFVTRTGYQKGAREIAEKHGIILCELREPTEEDWKGRVKGFHLTQDFFFPRFTDVNFVFDKEWVFENIEKPKRAEGDSDSIQMEIVFADVFYDEAGIEVTSVEGIAALFYPSELAEATATRKKYVFDKPTFIQTDKESLPKIKVNAVELTVSVDKVTQEVQIKGEDFVSFVLKDVLNGTEYSFDNDLKLRE